MSQNHRARRSNMFQLLKKAVVSAFVVGTFVAYAIHDRLTNSDGAVGLASPSNPNEIALASSPTAALASVVASETATSTTVPATVTQIPATATPSTMPPASNTSQPLATPTQ